MSNKALQGKVALITGASRGLGKSIALAMAAAGARLALVARNADSLNQVAEAARKSGTDAMVYPADVTNEAAIRGLEQAVVKQLGAPHILVNNAGTNLRKPLADFTLVEWQRVMDTNLTSAFLV